MKRRKKNNASKLFKDNVRIFFFLTCGMTEKFFVLAGVRCKHVAGYEVTTALLFQIDRVRTVNKRICTGIAHGHKEQRVLNRFVELLRALLVERVPFEEQK